MSSNSIFSKSFSFALSKNKTESQLYSYWRFRVMFALIIGYAAFYFVRQNLSFAIPQMQIQLGFTKAEVGMIATAFSLIYSLGKAISGYLGDKSSARTFMVTGLLLSAIVNILMGFTTSLWFLIAFWSLNACFQSMGAPSCAKVLTHWFGPKEIGTMWSLWSASQQLGAAIIGVIAAILVVRINWQAAFFFPAGMCIIISGIVYLCLRDEPKTVNLKNLEEYEGLSSADADECATMSSWQILMTRVLCNSKVWVMCLANFFLYFVRMGVFIWAPTFLCEAKCGTASEIGLQVAMFNIAGIFGSISAGVLSDKVFEGARGKVGLLFMIGLTLSIIGLLVVPSNMPLINVIIMFALGFFVAGPQTMVGVAAVDFSSKKAAGSASGLTGTFGYLGSAIAGSGIGYIVDKKDQITQSWQWLFGWEGAFALMLFASLAGAVCLGLSWNWKARSLQGNEKSVGKKK